MFPMLYMKYKLFFFKTLVLYHHYHLVFWPGHQSRHHKADTHLNPGDFFLMAAHIWAKEKSTQKRPDYALMKPSS